MGRKRTYTPLNVFMNRRHVGQLTREANGAIHFTYTSTWLDWEHRLPVSLSLPLRDDRHVGAPVMAVFDNLLPDNMAMRRRVAERVGAQGTDAFSMLSEIGRDCIGALQFLPDTEPLEPMDALTGDPVDEADIAALLGDLDVSPLGIRQESDFRISVAGAQDKTALLHHDGKWIRPTGTTPTTHILKPRIGRLSNGMDLSDSVENEFLCLKLMEAFGLRAAKTEITTFGNVSALVIERFDRMWTKDGRLIRLPQEDCCQALSIPPTQKYQNEGGPGIVEIMELLRGSDRPSQDREDFFKANILFWLIGATDGHAKNFSLSLLPGGRFHLTPLYDVLTVQPTVDARQIERKDFKLAMRWGKSKHYRIGDVFARHVMQTGMTSGLSKEAIQSIIEDLHATTGTALERAFRDLPNGFPQRLVESVAMALPKRLERLM